MTYTYGDTIVTTNGKIKKQLKLSILKIIVLEFCLCYPKYNYTHISNDYCIFEIIYLSVHRL